MSYSTDGFFPFAMIVFVPCAVASLAALSFVCIPPVLVLKRIPYRLALRPLDVPSYRSTGFAVRDKKSSSLAVKKFT